MPNAAGEEGSPARIMPEEKVWPEVTSVQAHFIFKQQRLQSYLQPRTLLQSHQRRGREVRVKSRGKAGRMNRGSKLTNTYRG